MKSHATERDKSPSVFHWNDRNLLCTVIATIKKNHSLFDMEYLNLQDIQVYLLRLCAYKIFESTRYTGYQDYLLKGLLRLCAY